MNIFEKLAKLINGQDEGVEERSEPTTKAKPSMGLASNSIDLADAVENCVKHSLQPYFFAADPPTLAAIRLHLEPNSTEEHMPLALQATWDAERIAQLQAGLRNVGIRFAPTFEVLVQASSESFDRYPRALDNVAVELVFREAVAKGLELVLRAVTGHTWEDEYVLTPEGNGGRPYYIGRGKAPKFPGRPRRTNHIAFVDPEEDPNPAYEVNKYVSRATGRIRYDEELQGFVLANEMSQGVLRIFRTNARGEEEELRLSIPNYDYLLMDGDMIVINREVELSVTLRRTSE